MLTFHFPECLHVLSSFCFIPFKGDWYSRHTFSIVYNACQFIFSYRIFIAVGRLMGPSDCISIRCEAVCQLSLHDIHSSCLLDVKDNVKPGFDYSFPILAVEHTNVFCIPKWVVF